MGTLFGSGGGQYQNNDELAESGEAFNITKVIFQPGEGFEGADRWLIVTDLEIPNITLSTNKKRDEKLEELAEHLRQTKKPYGPVLFVKSKRAYFFNDAPKEQKIKDKPKPKPIVSDDEYIDEIPF